MAIELLVETRERFMVPFSLAEKGLSPYCALLGTASCHSRRGTTSEQAWKDAARHTARSAQAMIGRARHARGPGVPFLAWL